MIPPKVKAALASALAEYKASLNRDARPGPDWVSAKELAEAWGMHREYIRVAAGKLIASGRMERKRTGNVVYYRVVP